MPLQWAEKDEPKQVDKLESRYHLGQFAGSFGLFSGERAAVHWYPLARVNDRLDRRKRQIPFT